MYTCESQIWIIISPCLRGLLPVPCFANDLTSMDRPVVMYMWFAAVLAEITEITCAFRPPSHPLAL